MTSGVLLFGPRIVVKLKSKCCEKYEEKAKLCKEYPLLATFRGKEKKRFLKKAKKRLTKAA